MTIMESDNGPILSAARYPNIPGNTDFAWPDEAVQMVKDGISCGKSCGIIAKELTRHFRHSISRNAVCGKVQRLGLATPKDERLPRQPIEKLPNPNARAWNGESPKRKRLQLSGRGVLGFKITNPPHESIPAEPDPPTLEHRCDLLSLKNHSCRWPIGDPGAEDFFFCGTPDADLDKHRPYCAFHSRLATGGKPSEIRTFDPTKSRVLSELMGIV